MKEQKASKLFSLVLLLTLVLASGCRPSQQSRRGASTKTNQNRTAGSGNRTLDSLVMVQNHLLDLLDTMTDVLAQDRMRIQRLEQEIARLKSGMRTSGSYVPPQAPQQSYAYVPPASPPAPNQQLPTAAPPMAAQPSTNYPLGPDTKSRGEERYTEALKLFNQGQHQLALERFQELQLTDPEGPLAPNYVYWKGESQYALGRYTDAINSFHDLLEQFPNSTKTDDAEFKIAESYEKLGNKANARNVYRRLLREHPTSEYKSRVEARLNVLE